MTTGLKTIIFPVTDIKAATARFQALLGVAPMVDQPYYVQFQVGGQDIGLDPHGHKHGATPYWHVTDLKASLDALLAAGAESVQDVKEVGPGRLIAAVKDPDGNVIGLLQDPEPGDS